MYPSSMCRGLPIRLIDTVKAEGLTELLYKHIDDDDVEVLIGELDVDYGEDGNCSDEHIFFIKCDTSYDPSRYNEYYKFPPRLTKQKLDKKGKLILNGVGVSGQEKLTNGSYPFNDDIYEFEYLKFMIGRGLIVDHVSRIAV